MLDFIEWCVLHNLNLVYESKSEKKNGKLITYKDALASGVRDIRKDLSGDYKDHARSFGTVWPWKVLHAPGEGKPVANVAK